MRLQKLRNLDWNLGLSGSKGQGCSTGQRVKGRGQKQQRTRTPNPALITASHQAIYQAEGVEVSQAQLTAKRCEFLQVHTVFP